MKVPLKLSRNQFPILLVLDFFNLTMSTLLYSLQAVLFNKGLKMELSVALTANDSSKNRSHPNEEEVPGYLKGKDIVQEEPVVPKAFFPNREPLHPDKVKEGNHWLKLARLHAKNPNQKNVIEDYEKALEFTDDVTTYAEYADLLWRRNSSKAGKALLYLACLHTDQSNKEDAIVAHLKAIKSQPDNEELKRELNGCLKWLELVETEEEKVHRYKEFVEISVGSEMLLFTSEEWWRNLRKHLDLFVNVSPSEGNREVTLKAIEQLYKNDPKKTELILQWQNIEDTGALRLATALTKNHTFQTLDLFANRIGDVTAQVLANALTRNNTLQKLLLGYNTIGDVGTQALGKALTRNQILQSLDLSSNRIGDVGTRALANALTNNYRLQVLNLGGNLIGDLGAQSIASVLTKNHTLQSLDLWRNQIGDAGAQALGIALISNQILQSLDLSNNRIGNMGTRALANALTSNQTLQALRLSDNSIGDVGTQAIANTLASNQTLQFLDLGYNQIGDVGTQILAKTLARNYTLKTLYLGSNSIGNVGAQALANALANNQTLQYLHLSDNLIDDGGEKTLKQIDQYLTRNKKGIS